MLSERPRDSFGHMTLLGIFTNLAVLQYHWISAFLEVSTCRYDLIPRISAPLRLHTACNWFHSSYLGVDQGPLHYHKLKHSKNKSYYEENDIIKPLLSLSNPLLHHLSPFLCLGNADLLEDPFRISGMEIPDFNVTLWSTLWSPFYRPLLGSPFPSPWSKFLH